MAEAIKNRVLGLSWRRLENEVAGNEENDAPKSPNTKNRAGIKKNASDSSLGSNAPRKMKTLTRRLSQAVSTTNIGMAEAWGSFRNKIRSSTRRRKRLFEVQTPYREPLSTVDETPPRRSARIAQRTEMYSPFCIDTPSSTTRTPAKIRMGLHTPKRFNFSSPGQLQEDIVTVEESLRQLNDLSEAISGTSNTTTTPRSTIRTTPGGRRSSSVGRRRQSRQSCQSRHRTPIFV